MECSICPYNINSRNENGTGCGENVCINEQILNENEQFYEENVPKGDKNGTKKDKNSNKK